MNRNFERIVGKFVPPRSTSLLSLSRPGTFRLPTVSGPGRRGFDFCSRILSRLPLFHESHPSSNLSISQREEPLWGAPASQGTRAGKLKNDISLVRWGRLSLSLGTVLLFGSVVPASSSWNQSEASEVHFVHGETPDTVKAVTNST